MNKDQKTSYEIMMQAHEIINELMHSEGETNENIESQIDEFLGDSADKMERHRFVIDDAQARAKKLKEQAAKFTAEAKKYENTAKRVKEHAKQLLEARVELMGWDEGRKVNTGMGPIYLSKRKSMAIQEGAEADLLRELKMGSGIDCINYKESVNKVKLKAALLSGEMTSEMIKDMAKIEERISVTFK